MKMRGKILFSITVSALVALAFTPLVVAEDIPYANWPGPAVTGSLTTSYDQTVYGDVVVAEDGGHALVPPPVAWTLTITTIPSGAVVKDAFLYLSFDNLENGDVCVEFIPPTGPSYTLCDPYDTPGPPYFPRIWQAGPFSTARYTVTSLVTGSGTYTVNVLSTGTPASVYGAALVVIYLHPAGTVGAPDVRVIINDGCWWVAAGPTFPQAWGFTDFNPSPPISTVNVMDAHLTTMVQAGENSWTDEVRFNTYTLPSPGMPNDYFYGKCGFLWDVDKWDIQVTAPSWLWPGLNRLYFGSGPNPQADGYIVDFAILDIAYRWWPVGGTTFPPNKLALLAPYIILAALMTIAAVSVAVYWRKR